MNVVQGYSTKYIERRHRYCHFWFTAKKRDNVLWTIHMHADYIPSLDYVTEKDPFKEMARLENHWNNQLELKEK